MIDNLITFISLMLFVFVLAVIRDFINMKEQIKKESKRHFNKMNELSIEKDESMNNLKAAEKRLEVAKTERENLITQLNFLKPRK